MTEHQTLAQHLADWRGEDPLRYAVSQTVERIADACCAIAEIIALGPLAGRLGEGRGENVDGDTQAELDIRANDLLLGELKAAPVACVASEELNLPCGLNEQAPLCVAVDPLDGSSNIDTNVSVGTIFSVLPMRCGSCQPTAKCFVQKGKQQLAAGYVIYGPQTALVLTLGAGTHIFTLNPDTGEFCLTRAGVRISQDTHEFGMATSGLTSMTACKGSKGPTARITTHAGSPRWWPNAIAS
jgi:fructose-1,6-bisphosphatase I